MMQSFDSLNSQQQQQWRYPLYAVQKGNNAVPLRSLSEDDLQNLQLHRNCTSTPETDSGSSNNETELRRMGKIHQNAQRSGATRQGRRYDRT